MNGCSLSRSSRVLTTLLLSTLLALIGVLDKDVVAGVDVESLAGDSAPVRLAAAVGDELGVLLERSAWNQDVAWSIVY